MECRALPAAGERMPPQGGAAYRSRQAKGERACRRAGERGGEAPRTTTVVAALPGASAPPACPAPPALRFFDSDLMTMRVERVRGKMTPECSIAALTSAWISS